jgi:hypothetical protein
MSHVTVTVTPMKRNKTQLTSANRPPRARTVPRSVTKQAARISLPRSTRLRAVSTITAYTTATDVVDRATPEVSAADHDQSSTKRLKQQGSS